MALSGNDQLLTAAFVSTITEFVEGLDEDTLGELAKALLAKAHQHIKPVVVQAKSGGSGSGGKKPANAYARFMQRLSKHNKGEAPLTDLTVHTAPEFRNTATGKSWATYQEHSLDLLGKEMAMPDIIEQVQAATGNALKTSGIVWNVLTDEARQQVLAA